VKQACRTARVSRGTFYYWKPRFDESGYAGLEAFARRGPEEPKQTPSEIEERIIALRKENPDWGKKRLADELAKANNWVPLVSPNTVKRILVDAGLWEAAVSGAGKKARQAGQSDR
jgi:transposase